LEVKEEDGIGLTAGGWGDVQKDRAKGKKQGYWSENKNILNLIL